MHICEYVMKGSRPKKPIMVLAGECDTFNTYFRKPSDLTLTRPHAGDVLAHATHTPLFMDPSTLWVDMSFEPGPLKKLLSGEILQPVIYNTPCDIELAELAAEWKHKVQIIDKSFLKAGSKVQKEFISWLLTNEFDLKSSSQNFIVDQLSTFFSQEDFFRSYDRMTQVIYGLPSQFLDNVDALKKWLTKTSATQWKVILDPPRTPLTSEVVDAFFVQSKSAYMALEQYLRQGGQPLVLLKALQTQTRHYLNASWAIRSAKGTNTTPLSIAQGQKVLYQDFKKYQDKVFKFFQEPILWKLLKDITLTQAKYQKGSSSQLPLYSLLITYVGPGF